MRSALSPPSSHSLPPKAAGLGASVLIVDDDEELLALNLLVLREAGMTASGVGTGAECLATIAVDPPELILLDMNLPDISGLEVCRAIKQNPDTAGVFVVFLSGEYTSSEEQAAGLDAGAEGYIVRPLGHHELVARISVMLRIRRAEAELHTVTEKLRVQSGTLSQIMDYSLDAICSLDSDGRFIEVSAAVERKLGYRRDELLGRRHLELVFHADREKTAAAMTLVMAGEQTGGFENRYVRKDGGIVVLMWSANWSESRRTMFCVARDVTESRVAERALHRMGQRLQTTLERMTDAFYMLDREWSFTYLNGGAERLLMRPREEILGRNIWEELPHHAQPFLRERYEHCFVANESTHFEVDYAPEDRCFEVHAYPSEEGLAVYFRDVTERRRSEELLRESHERFRQFAETVEDAFLLVHAPTKEILYINPAFRRLSGYSDDCSVADVQSCFEFVHPSDRQRVLQAFDRVSEAMHQEFRILRQDGTIISVWSHLFPIRNANGSLQRIAGVIRDITERKQLEAQILRAQRMESIGTLAGGMAHDLNNVLAPILMSIELLKLRHGDEETKGILECIGSSAARGAEMVKQVLSFARGVEGERAPVEPRFLLGEIQKMVSETFPKNISFQTLFKPGLWDMLGDRTQLLQVLLNLCVNARDAMPDGGKLTVTVENVTIDEAYSAMDAGAKPGSHVMISVRDTGTGMSPETIDKIFDPFFTTKELGKGTGLGLSSSLAIVSSHGGFIQVRSEIDKGSEFRVHIPATSPAAQRVCAPKADLRRGNGELILVIDDEASIRRITQQTLEAFGYQVILATDGAEAVALYAQRQSEIAAVLTDIMMPIMDGTAAVQVFSRMNPDVRIIAATGMNFTGRDPKALSPTVKGFLAKPYSAEALLKTLADVIAAPVGG